MTPCSSSAHVTNADHSRYEHPGPSCGGTTGTSSCRARTWHVAATRYRNFNFILAELRRALSYPRVRQRYTISNSDVDEFESLLRGVADTVAVTAQSPVVPTDPDDDPIIATAIIGQSDVLCTLDRHLRQPLIQAYCATFNIRVFTDLELLAELRGSATPGA